jgi:hypothetical protein
LIIASILYFTTSFIYLQKDDFSVGRDFARYDLCGSKWENGLSLAEISIIYGRKVRLHTPEHASIGMGKIGGQTMQVKSTGQTFKQTHQE